MADTPNPAKLKGYRTIIFNLIMTAIMALSLWMPQQHFPDATVVNIFLDHLQEVAIAVWSAGNFILRFITTTPVFKKE